VLSVVTLGWAFPTGLVAAPLPSGVHAVAAVMNVRPSIDVQPHTPPVSHGASCNS